MARQKKSKKTKKSTKKIQADSRNYFWSYIAAVILFFVAIFIIIGGFNSGGPLPTNLYKFSNKIFGYSAFIFALSLVYMGVYKFITEDKRVPLAKLFNIFLLIVLSSIWFQVSFVNQTPSGNLGGHGGVVGQFFGDFILKFLTKIPSSLLFGISSLLSIFFAFSLSPKILLGLFKIFKLPKKDEGSGELIDLKNKGGDQITFKLNEGVPVVHHQTAETSIKQPSRLSSLKNTAEKLSDTQMHNALTTKKDSQWKFPPIDLLNQKPDKADPGDVNLNAKRIHDTFANFKIEVEMEGANVGPRVTQYTLKPPADVKLTKITALENNLALDLAAHSIRMEAPIPGKRAVGIEVPNIKPATVRISSLLSSREWANLDSPLGFVIGKDISGSPIVADLARMPHLLVAGQTGSGKSVLINSLLTSLLYRNSPSDLKLILVDPKQVEMGPYNGIAHLLSPVINDPEKCISALKWAVAEMERRLRTMAESGKRNIAEYNNLKEESGMPYIVIVIDELADLMMMAAREVEALVVRLAQKARAAGIHLVLATQRPSVDVITGLIKANVPARIAFTVASQVDSRTIIDQIGAEKLLGRGDMLLLTSEMNKPKRIQAALIEDQETAKVTEFIRLQQPPSYDDEIVSQPVHLNKGGQIADYSGTSGDDEDSMWRDAVAVVIENRKASTSLLQRRLRIGYGRAARIMETMEDQGIIGPQDGSRPREVLVSSLDEVFNSGNLEASDDNLSEPSESNIE